MMRRSRFLRLVCGAAIATLALLILREWYDGTGASSLEQQEQQQQQQQWPPAPVLQRRGGYWIVANLWSPDPPAAADLDPAADTTLATQCTPDHLHHVARSANQWGGPVSAAVFAPSDTLAAVRESAIAMAFQRRCHEGVRRHVTFSLVVPVAISAAAAAASGAPAWWATLMAIDENSPAVPPCPAPAASGAHAASARVTFNYARPAVPYPNNLLRNVARAQANTAFVLVVDVDVLPYPARAVRQAFARHLARYPLSSQKKVFVLPVFEVQENASRGDFNKISLAKAHKQHLVRPFYAALCPHCQAPTRFDVWWNATAPYSVPYTDPWEPFFIAKTSEVPLFDERFKQYGFNRISQACETHMAGFDFEVLPDSFLVHEGFKNNGSFHPSKQIEQAANRQLFRKMKEEMKVKYFATKRRCERLHR